MWRTVEADSGSWKKKEENEHMTNLTFCERKDLQIFVKIRPLPSQFE